MHIFTNMKIKNLEKTIKIPEGVEVSLDGTNLIVKGKEGENKRNFKIKRITIEKQDNQIKIICKKTTKNEKKIMNTLAAHITNMIKGVQHKFEYKLKVCFSHFPITIDIKENEANIKNFLGEKIPRKANIPKGVEVDISKDEITVKSTDRELGGQAAANFEKATWIRKRDRRIFQDGIFITHKPGREE